MTDGLGRLGVICTPGSYTGAYTAGYLKAMEEHGINPQVFQGSSVGALNALGFLSQGADRLIEVWKYVESEGPEFLYFNDSTWQLLKSLVGNKPLYGRKGLRELLDLSGYERVQKDLPELRVVVFNETEDRVEIVSSRHEAFRNNPELFRKLILASCSPAGVFPPVEIRGSVYTDAVFFSVTDLVYQECDTVFVFFNDLHNIASGSYRATAKNWWLQRVIARRDDYKDYVEHIKRDLRRHRNRCVFFRVEEQILSANKFKKGDITRAIDVGHERGLEILSNLDI